MHEKPRLSNDRIILAPYYWALRLRHFFYDKGWRKVRTSPVPAICVGNLAAGGTGKTPFTEFLLRLLAAERGDVTAAKAGGRRVGVLSRGYGRRSKGFLYVQTDGTPELFGDEPLQIKRKFPDVPVAVCSSRIEGCEKMAADGCGLILLDDAFQHRALKADCNIVLVEYGRPLASDRLLPLGRLRDLPERIHAADIVIASKCPDDLTAGERQAWLAGLGLEGAYDARTANGTEPGTPVFFTTLQYGQAEGVFEEADRHYLYSGKMILFTAIANDRPLQLHLIDRYSPVAHLRFPDHHDFRPADLRKIEQAAAKYPEAILFTTEKDRQRLLPLRGRLSDNLRRRLFYLPVEARFVAPDEEDAFVRRMQRFTTVSPE